ncbi:NAD(P)/FAD-dependent oxidoreductase [Gordonia sp. (in: high G+C Gram-positive bacteria)]|uniref:flavin-containing monooxygenase n=1 Tax=Gordonia sp. (in: high G+C Gram-positive bacteria) TaxID=84139 RepID=UPI0025BF90DF|nr:NAD(P)/FAD-dependent oxidoreductase [Gordonia sp. (in: high G+C Gram-positive bacteria)]
MTERTETSPQRTDVPAPLDAVVVGAGFAGIYSLYRLRKDGLSVRVFEAAEGVGGVWYWNRYPGARCDVESVDYSFSFDDDLQQEWNWREKYATQPEILEYMEHVVERFDLARDITLNTRVTDILFDEDSLLWTVTTDTGEAVRARFVVLGLGPLSNSNIPNIPGIGDFAGPLLHTGQWPHEPVDFTGQRVGVIGTGSSGIQSIPEIAKQARQLTVFQRSPNFSVPAGNRDLTDDDRAEQKAGYAERRRLSFLSGGGSPHQPHPHGALEVSDDERRAVYEEWWQKGGVLFSKAFPDQFTSVEANDTAREFWVQKVRAKIDDPAIAEQLIPTDHPIGTKRICTDSGYFETYNRENVELVNLRKAPIERIDATGVVTADGRHHDLDALVLATGYDAMTGSVKKINIVGRGGRTLNDEWAAGARTYLGLGLEGFPNLFNLTGPGSPSVLANMVLHSELHVDWVADAIAELQARGASVMEPTNAAVEGWVEECRTRAESSLMSMADSWYVGANIAGRPRVFMPFLGGLGAYGEIIGKVAADGYPGFEFTAS